MSVAVLSLRAIIASSAVRVETRPVRSGGLKTGELEAEDALVEHQFAVHLGGELVGDGHVALRVDGVLCRTQIFGQHIRLERAGDEALLVGVDLQSTHGGRPPSAGAQSFSACWPGRRPKVVMTSWLSSS